MNPWMAIIGAALGGLRASNEQRNANKQRDTEITRELWSPWTGRKGNDVQNADVMGRVMQGAGTGMMMGQSMGQDAAQSGAQTPAAQPNAYSNVPQMGSRVNGPAQGMAPMQMMQQEQYPSWQQQPNMYGRMA